MKNDYLAGAFTISMGESYLEPFSSYSIQDVYTMGIDEEIDIFSELPLELFSEAYGKQMADVMRLFKKEYTRYVYERELSSVLPKLKYFIDEEGASVVQLASSWNGGNASLYFAFEQNENESSFGMVWNDSAKKNFESRSGSIILNNMDEVIHEVLDFIFRVY